MDNSMDNMLDMYLFETNSLLEQLEEILLEAEKSGIFTIDDVNEIFRTMHTIKGSSAMMEFSSLMKTAHKIEDLFFILRENGVDRFNEICPEEEYHELFDLIFRSTDLLRSEVEKVENNEPLSDNIDSFIDDINTCSDKIKAIFGEESTESKDTDENENNKNSGNLPNDDSPFFVRIFFDEGCGMENLRAFMLVNSIKDACENFRFYPEDVESNSESSSTIIESGFILAFADKESVDKVISVLHDSGNIQTYEVIENPLAKVHNEEKTEEETEDKAKKEEKFDDDTEKVSTQKSAPAQSKQANSNHNASQNKQSLISVNLSKLDFLMAIVGELVITESMVTSSPDIQGMKLDNFTKSTRQLRKLTDELQGIAMSIRMVPISGVFQKMNRIVRDMGQKLKKNVRLKIIGENTEVDKTIVDAIGDPIMHIVRNSMDHGIEENQQDRINAGKDPQGEIVLSAEHTGSEVIISVKDDGKGINPAVILNKARNNGLLVKPESEYTQKEVLALLMVPGFSTNEQVTEFSGRGVGMDVVKKNIEQIGGTITITSEYGQGTTMTLKIPLTLAIVDGMEVAVGNSTFIIPIQNIKQSFKVTADEVIYDASHGEIVKRMGEFYPIIRIHELYNIDTEITNIEDGILMWVEESDKSYCLFVDELLGEQQIVVKPLPSYFDNFNIKNSGITGCTILGDGNISIILNILNLYAVAHNLF